MWNFAQPKLDVPPAIREGLNEVARTLDTMAASLAATEKNIAAIDWRLILPHLAGGIRRAARKSSREQAVLLNAMAEYRASLEEFVCRADAATKEATDTGVKA